VSEWDEFHFGRLAVPAHGVEEMAVDTPYEVGAFAMTLEDPAHELYLAHAEVSIGTHEDGYVDFITWSAETMGYLWASWIFTEVSHRRRDMVVLYANEPGDWVQLLKKSWDELPIETIADLEDVRAPLEFFATVIRAVAPTITVRPIDDEFMRALPERAPPWPDGEVEIPGVPRWQGDPIS
jgi:hypothetical protein